MKRIIGILLIAIISFSLNSCVKNPVTGKRDFMLMSENQEIAMGKQSDPSIVASFGLYQNEEIQKFINKKGQEMAKISHRPKLNYEFKVLDSPVVNAFALPGGYVYFTRGILAHFNNEAEFAGVLGHEIGHVTARHSAKQYSQQMVAQAGLIIGMVASPKFAQYANVAQTGLGLMFLKFSRNHESESDGLGVEYSTKIGYDAHHMANFFKTLKRMSGDSGQSIPTFMSTHPDPGKRYENVNKLATETQNKLNAHNLKVNRNSYLKMIDGLVYGEDPRQGYFENDIFYHPEMKFSFPVPMGWQTQNMPSQVQMAPKDGKALVMFTLAEGNSLVQAKNSIIEQYKLNVVSSSNEKVNGFNAIKMISVQKQETQQGQQQQAQTQPAIKIVTYLIQYSGNIFVFHGMAYENDFTKYKYQFNKVMTGFKKLSDPSKINVVPDRIHVVTVKSNGTFSQAIKSFGVTDSAKMKELAILNSMLLSDKVTKGQLIKILGK